MSEEASSLSRLWKRCSAGVCAAARAIKNSTKELFSDWPKAAARVCASSAMLGVLAITSAEAKLIKYNITTIPLPGVQESPYQWPDKGGFASGINNNGLVVGSVYGTNECYGQCGYVYDINTSTYVNFSVDFGTEAHEINDSGEVVGYGYGSRNIGYKYKNGVITLLPLYNSMYIGINNNGVVAGCHASVGRIVQKNGTYSELVCPDNPVTRLYGINDKNQIIGACYKDSAWSLAYYFIYDNGNWTHLDYYNAPISINNKGQVLLGGSRIYNIARNTYIDLDTTNFPGRYAGFNDSGQIIGTTSNGGESLFIATPIGPDPTPSTPVVVIPGIAGSMSSCLFVDPASGEACPDNYIFKYSFGAIKIPLTPTWVLDRTAAHAYDSLVKELRNADKLVYPMPYDWRKDNRLTARTKLANTIALAKKQTGSGKVDIVAHSMGGLVARSYIEQLNKTDVRKLVMLGTPNRGSANAYYSWEGGDFSKSGPVADNAFFQPLIKAMRAGYGQGSTPVHKFIRYAVPAMQQLLPADRYLYKYVNGNLVSISIAEMEHTNNLVPKLNYATLIKNVGINNIQIFAGNNADTISSIIVEPARPSAEKWADGIPLDIIDPNLDGTSELPGDGTVTAACARLGKINVHFEDSKHTDLPDHCRTNVVRFLDGKPLVKTAFSAEKFATKELAPQRPHVESEIVLGTSSNIRMGLVTAEGLRLGVFPFEHEIVSEPEAHLYVGSKDRTSALGIDNPVKGEYLLNVTTQRSEEDYNVIVSYSTKKGGRDLILKGTVARGEVKTYSIQLNDGLELH